MINNRKGMGLVVEPARKDRIFARIAIGSLAVFLLVLLVLGCAIFFLVHGTDP